VRVYVGEQTLETIRLWLVDQRLGPSAEEISAVLRQLDENSTMTGLRSVTSPDEATRRAAIEQKNDLLARIRTAQESPPPKLLFSGSATSPALDSDLAEAILGSEIGLPPTRSISRQFEDDLLAGRQPQLLHITADQVHDWLLEHRDLVEQELFFDPPDPAVSVVTPGTPVQGRPADPATASAVVAACERAWAAIQDHHPELPDAVVVLGTGVERGRLVKLGHWWGGRWVADGQLRGEVLIAGEALHLDASQVFEVLLHEAAHGLNAARGVKDTSRGGRYHNRRFAEAASEVLLRVRPMAPYGMADTKLSDAAAGRYAETIGQLGEAMRIARQLESPTVRSGTERDQDNRGGAEKNRNGGSNAVATCGCGRRLRMAPSVLAAGPVTCGLCGDEFVITNDRARSRSAPSSSATVGRTPTVRDGAASTAEAPYSLDRQKLGRQRDRLAAAISSGIANARVLEPLVDRHQRLAALLGAGLEQPLSDTQREGLIDLRQVTATTADREAITRWYERFGTADEQPVAAGDQFEDARRTRFARALLKADGTLRGPAVTFGSSELMAGDRVISDAPSGADLPSGVPGTVIGVDSQYGTADVDFATWGRLRTRVNDAIDAGLRHDYTEPRSMQKSDPHIELDRILPDLEP
jgi:hypothetical protein